MTGQSTVLNAAVPYSAVANGIGALTAAAYPIPGLYLLCGTMVATGGILRWFRDQFGLSAAAAEHGEEVRAAIGAALARRDDPFSLLDRLAASAPPGSNGLVLLPYFLGERSPIWDSDARGVLLGLSMATSRAEVVRAILEGTAYGMNHNLEELRRLGIAPPALRVVGGGARGRTWNQIKADVTGLPVEVPSGARGATVGSALLAAAGVGTIADLAEGVRRRYAPGERFLPDPRSHQRYRGYYELYRTLYPTLSATFRSLGRLRSAT
jgi:xylulokinase